MFFAGMIWYNRIIKTILRACPKHGCGNVRTIPLQSAVLQDNKKERTLAIAMPESLFHRVEQYVEAHNGVSKRVFVVGLVAQELQSWLMEQSPDEVQDQEFGPDQDEQGFGMSMTM